MGNITRDIELRQTPQGNAVCDIGLAMNRKYTKDNGEKVEEATFIDVAVWGRQAAAVWRANSRQLPTGKCGATACRSVLTSSAWVGPAP